MVNEDLEYIQRLIEDKIISGPVLELGAGYGGNTCRKVIESAGMSYFGTDIIADANVDFVANFEDALDLKQFQALPAFGAVLILNVLEHTFDPIRIMDNATSLLRSGGSLVVLTPAIWPLHNFPMDAWRILPNYYQEYAKRKGFKLLDEYFEYIGYGAVDKYKNEDLTYSFPMPGRSRMHNLYSRVIHKLFNTFGRSMLQPSHIAVGAVFTI